jgi:prepilin-type N-terminal cleavage/methylation domain-containing protein
VNSFRPSPFRRHAGFSFIELMIASTIMALVVVGMVSAFSQGSKVYYMDRARLMINRDIRSFTSQIDSDAVTANFFVLYPNFSTRSTTAAGVTTDASVVNGQVGDFLVLVYTDPAQTGYGVSMINRIVGYYREVTDSTLNTGPVHRFDITLGTAVSTTSNPMYTIVNNVVTGTAASYPIVTQLAQGLATNASGTTVTPALFYNFQNRSIMIDTQFSESLTEVGTTSQTGNTYNFTVSPRG